MPNSCETTPGTVYCPNLSLTTSNTKLSRFSRGLLQKENDILESFICYISNILGLYTLNGKQISKTMKRWDQNSSHLLQHEFGTETQENKLMWTFWPDTLKRGNKTDSSSLHPVMKTTRKRRGSFWVHPLPAKRGQREFHLETVPRPFPDVF